MIRDWRVYLWLTCWSQDFGKEQLLSQPCVFPQQSKLMMECQRYGMISMSQTFRPRKGIKVYISVPSMSASKSPICKKQNQAKRRIGWSPFTTSTGFNMRKLHPPKKSWGDFFKRSSTSKLLAELCPSPKKIGKVPPSGDSPNNTLDIPPSNSGKRSFLQIPSWWLSPPVWKICASQIGNHFHK